MLLPQHIYDIGSGPFQSMLMLPVCFVGLNHKYIVRNLHYVPMWNWHIVRTDDYSPLVYTDFAFVLILFPMQEHGCTQCILQLRFRKAEFLAISIFSHITKHMDIIKNKRLYITF